MRNRTSTNSFRIAPDSRALVILLAMCTACGYSALEGICGGVYCGPGLTCAANQPVCIPMDGCGNGIIDKGEACDDGNIVDGEMTDGGLTIDKCNHDCTSTQVCGNSIKDVSEECDHGELNGTPGTSCDSGCHLVSSVCGNAVVDRDQGEQCDPGDMDSADCNSTQAGSLGCKAPKCGDGYVNAAARETCDSGGVNTSQCNGPLCTRPTCGDYFNNTISGEECDSGIADTVACNGRNAGMASCHLARCGDGYRNPLFTPPGTSRPEECDVGVPCLGGKTCNSACNCI